MSVNSLVNAPSEKKYFRILYISSDKFPPFRVDVAVLFGKKMVARGHKIDWILQSEDDLEKDMVEEWWGGKVWVGSTDNRTSLFSRIRKHLKSMRNDLRMFRIARNNKYDFIQVKDKFLSAVLGIVAAKLNKTKFIYWLSYPFPEAYLYRKKEGTARYPLLYLIRGNVFKWLLYRLIMPRADHVIVQSEQMKRDVILEGVNENKLTAIPMGVEIEAVPYVSEEVAKKNDKSVVVYLGTLARVRRMDFLLHAFAETRKSIPDAILYLVGSSEDELDIDLLKKDVERLGLDGSVIFTGYLSIDKAWDYVRGADVCVSPFYPTPILNSTSPTKLVEYMAMAKAVVANDHPEQSQVIAESGVGICVPYEEKAFGDAMAELLANKELATAMGKKGRLYVELNRSYDVIAEKLETQYRLISD